VAVAEVSPLSPGGFGCQQRVSIGGTLFALQGQEDLREGILARVLSLSEELAYLC
jgi:hypothetical protein